MLGKYYYGTGRRKSAVARVFLQPGQGQIVVNDKPIDEYFARETSRMIVRQPLELVGHGTTFDIKVNVVGGGETGQAGAVRHGVTRALIDYSADLKQALKQAGFVDLRRIDLDPRQRTRRRAQGRIAAGCDQLGANRQRRQLVAGKHQGRHLEIAAQAVTDAGLAIDRDPGQLQGGNVAIHRALGHLQRRRQLRGRHHAAVAEQ